MSTESSQEHQRLGERERDITLHFLLCAIITCILCQRSSFMWKCFVLRYHYLHFAILLLSDAHNAHCTQHWCQRMLISFNPHLHIRMGCIDRAFGCAIFCFCTLYCIVWFGLHFTCFDKIWRESDVMCIRNVLQNTNNELVLSWCWCFCCCYWHYCCRRSELHHHHFKLANNVATI